MGFDLEGIAARAWERDAGYADPVGATQGLLERAVEEGGKTRLYTAVVDLKAAERGRRHSDDGSGRHRSQQKAGALRRTLDAPDGGHARSRPAADG